ncbi:MAG: ATP synthase F0 subunit C [Candidatus Aminicenantes bacterium]|nr:ATP synthase F0 subunit C [Candidatus Aminicenantes bacterium]
MKKKPMERSDPMKRDYRTWLVLTFLLSLATGSALAAQEALDPVKAKLFSLSIIVGGAIITLAAAAGAFCQAKAISSACEGISRNPAAAPHIRFLLIFGLVLIETLVIYALLITIIILMVQWGKYI